jgi:uncharacterized protein (TIGR03067 family)
MARCLVLAVLAALPPSAGRPAPGGAAARGLARLQGEWDLICCEEGGQKLAGAHLGFLRGFRFRVRGHRLILGAGFSPQELSLRLGRGKGRGCLDAVARADTPKGRAARLRYDVRGDVLRVCGDREGKERPPAIAAPEGTPWVVLTFRRVRR